MRMAMALVAALALNGCTYAVHLSEVDQIDPVIHSKNATRIKSEAEQFVVLGFVTQTDYVNEAYEGLMKKCPSGQITGVNTRSSTAHGFLSWHNRIKMMAWCLGSSADSIE